MKGTKGLFRLGAIALALSLIVLTGCDDGSKDDNGGTPSGGGKSIVVTSDAAAKTLTFTISGEDWVSSVQGSGIVEAVCTATTTGDIEDLYKVNYSASVSADKKVLTVTVSKSFNAGTITFTPKTSVAANLSGIGSSIAGGSTSATFTVTGEPVTFNIE